jgi:microcystin-dependent protein
VPVAISVGIVMAWPMTTVPSGWLECDGSAISRTTYAALFNVLGTAYGVGDGSTTFNLPSYKDYFLRGFDASGTDAASRTDRGDGTTGAAVGTKQANQLQATTPAGTVSRPSVTVTNGTQVSVLAGGSSTTYVSSPGTVNFVTVTAALASDPIFTGTQFGGSETRPKNITVKYIMLASVAASIPVGSGNTVSPRNMHTGAAPAHTSADGTDTTPSVTETYIAEVYIGAPTSVTGIALMNGSAVAGNVAVALANSVGAVLASSASTAQSGTDAYQRIPFTAALSATGPGTYYVLVQCNNTGARFNTHTFGNFGASKKTGETFGTFTTVTPPTTFTTALGPIASLY